MGKFGHKVQIDLNPLSYNLCLLGERTVEGYNVSLFSRCEDVSHLVRAIYWLGARADDNIHAESLSELGNSSADRAVADYRESLTRELSRWYREIRKCGRAFPLAGFNGAVVVADTAVAVEDIGENLLSDCVGRILTRIADGYAFLCGIFHIYVVIAGSEKSDVLYIRTSVHYFLINKYLVAENDISVADIGGSLLRLCEGDDLHLAELLKLFGSDIAAYAYGVPVENCYFHGLFLALVVCGSFFLSGRSLSLCRSCRNSLYLGLALEEEGGNECSEQQYELYCADDIEPFSALGSP